MVKAKWALLGVAGALALAVAAGGAAYAFDLGPFASGPQQPVAFPHDVHAGENQIPCMYCHTGADRSADAGIQLINTTGTASGVRSEAGLLYGPKSAAAYAVTVTYDESGIADKLRVIDALRRLGYDLLEHVS